MNEKITIRVPDSLRDRLSEKSEMEGVSVSEIARTILGQYFISLDNQYDENTNDDFHNQPTEDDNYIDETTPLEESDYEDKDIVNTVEFLQLVVWMFDQKESRVLKFDKTRLEKFKNTIIKIHSSSIMRQNLKDEFNKVFIDLIKELNSNYPFNSHPDFAYNDSGSFNFSLLTQFIFEENLSKKVITLYF
jgi:hypothetical protein